MTTNKHLKVRVRERMARTGERYVTARRQVVAAGAAGPARGTDVDDRGYRLRGGVHPETAAVANVLAHLGVTAGHTGEPLSEAMVLGVGGGLGAGYILWEFQAHRVRILVLGFRNQWQYPDRWTAKTLERLGVRAQFLTTGGARAAAAHLDAALDRGLPAIAWIDQQLIGHWHQPAFLEGHFGYPLVVYRREDDRVWIDDRNLATLSVARPTLDAARARIGSYRNRLVVMEPGVTVGADRLRAAVAAGLAECAEHLSRPSDSFSLPAWRKWARLLTDTRNAKAWPRVFADPSGLTGALVSAYEGVEPIGTDGGNLRELFAAFLDEAAVLLDRPELGGLARTFRDIAAAWHDFAEAVLPGEQPAFAAIRHQLAALHAAVVAEGEAGVDAARAAAAELWALRGRYRAETPMDAADTAALFADLSARLSAIHRAETDAIARLASMDLQAA